MNRDDLAFLFQEEIFNTLPALDVIAQEKTVLSSEGWQLLDWILSDRVFSIKTCEKSVVSKGSLI